MLRRSLGSATAAARGIVLSSATNATPHVATLAALHGIPSVAQVGDNFKSLRRFGIFGCTGGTSINGIWNLRSTGANTFSLEGSVTNGAVTTTNGVIAAIMDSTPFMRGHSCVAVAHGMTDQIAFDGTFAIMGNIQGDGTGSGAGATDAEILASDSTTLATFFQNCVSDVAWGVPGATNDGVTEFRNVYLRRWMYLDVSAYTAGGLEVDLLI